MVIVHIHKNIEKSNKKYREIKSRKLQFFLFLLIENVMFIDYDRHSSYLITPYVT
jgi:hypothetical protein